MTAREQAEAKRAELEELERIAQAEEEAEAAAKAALESGAGMLPAAGLWQALKTQVDAQAEKILLLEHRVYGR